MKLLVIGASAGVGRETVQLALSRGHQVCALARNLTQLADHASLEKVQGDATDPRVLQKLVKHADRVLVTLGTGMRIKKTTLYSDFARTLLQIHNKEPIEVSVLVLTGFGAGDSRPYLGFLMGCLFDGLLDGVYADKTRMEELIASSTLKWELVRPGLLTNAVATGRWRAQTELKSGMRVGRISRGNVAHFLVGEAEAPNYLNCKVALSNR